MPVQVGDSSEKMRMTVRLFSAPYRANPPCHALISSRTVEVEILLDPGKSLLFVSNILMESIRAACALPMKELGGVSAPWTHPLNFHRRADLGLVSTSCVLL